MRKSPNSLNSGILAGLHWSNARKSSVCRPGRPILDGPTHEPGLPWSSTKTYPEAPFTARSGETVKV